MFERKRNEPVWMLRRGHEKNAYYCPVEDIVCLRSLFLTNVSFPHGSFREDQSASWASDEEVLEKARLVCR